MITPVEGKPGAGMTFSDAPDYIVVRARDLKHVLMMWDSAVSLREKGGAWRHTEKTALGQLRNVTHSAASLDDLMKKLIAQISSEVQAKK